MDSKGLELKKGQWLPSELDTRPLTIQKILYPPKTNWCYSPFDKSEVGRRNSKVYTRCFWWAVTRVTGVQRGRDNKNAPFLVAYHQSRDHLCFQGNKGVIWIGTDFKRGIAAVCLEDLEPSATGPLWAYWLLIFSLCVTHTASGLWTQRLKKPSEPGWNKYICTFFFGSRSWQVKLVAAALYEDLAAVPSTGDRWRGWDDHARGSRRWRETTVEKDS